MSEPTKILKKPCVHPIIQVMTVEWKAAEVEKQSPDWSIFTTDYISSYCENQKANEPDWHPDLSSLDLGPYLEGLQEHKRWWEVGLPAPQDDDNVHMDPPALCAPPRVPAAPPTTALPSMPALPVATHSSKGKARALLPPASSDPHGTPPALHAPPPLPTQPAMPAAPSLPPASPAPYAFRVPRRYGMPETEASNTTTTPDAAPPDDDEIEDFDTTPCKWGGPSDTSIPQVHVDDGSPPPPAQRRRMDAKPLVATGNILTHSILFIAELMWPLQKPQEQEAGMCRRRLCTLPSSWALLVIHLRASQGVAFPEDVQGTLNLSDEGGSSHHSPMSLHSLSGTPGEDLTSCMKSWKGKMDYVILVLNAIAGRQGIVPSSLPGYIQPPPPCRSLSPSNQSQSSPGIPIASLGISDAHTNTPLGSGSVSDASEAATAQRYHPVVFNKERCCWVELRWSNTNSYFEATRPAADDLHINIPLVDARPIDNQGPIDGQEEGENLDSDPPRTEFQLRTTTTVASSHTSERSNTPHSEVAEPGNIAEQSPEVDALAAQTAELHIPEPIRGIPYSYMTTQTEVSPPRLVINEQTGHVQQIQPEDMEAVNRAMGPDVPDAPSIPEGTEMFYEFRLNRNRVPSPENRPFPPRREPAGGGPPNGGWPQGGGGGGGPPPAGPPGGPPPAGPPGGPAIANQQGNDKFIGNPPPTFTGSRSQAESFILQWEVYAGVNANHSAMRNKY
ncbi:hypothetical protein EI94DRAFT_1799068 [Lactarius quietus]|nr:hypothetical protein EI94DRAFT_1799068 [Lactarius quietus]